MDSVSTRVARMTGIPIDIISSPSSIWDALSGGGAFAAASVALVLGLRENKRRSREQREEISRLERERDAARDIDQRHRAEAQARQISVWVSNASISTGQTDQEGVPIVEHGYTITAVNYSRMPIFDAIFVAKESNGALRHLSLFENIFPEVPYSWETPGPVTHPLHGLLFRDAAGKWWIRFEDGALQDTEVAGRTFPHEV